MEDETTVSRILSIRRRQVRSLIDFKESSSIIDKTKNFKLICENDKKNNHKPLAGIHQRANFEPLSYDFLININQMFRT